MAGELVALDALSEALTALKKGEATDLAKAAASGAEAALRNKQLCERAGAPYVGCCYCSFAVVFVVVVVAAAVAAVACCCCCCLCCCCC